MIKKVSLAIGVLGLSISGAAQAELMVNPLLAFFSGNTNVQDITVTNDSNDTAYVEVIADSVENPGAPNEKLQLYQAGSDVSQFGLMVSPVKMAIPANASRKVRLVALKSQPATDLVYYLKFMPVTSAIANAAATAEGSSIQMSNQISYRVQALILPANPMPQVSITRQGTEVAVKNTGNSYASLRNGKICNTQGANCVNLPTHLSYKVLYAGNSWSFTAPSAGVVKYDVIYNKDKKMAVQSD